jgi:hypothetical protein
VSVLFELNTIISLNLNFSKRTEHTCNKTKFPKGKNKPLPIYWI